MGFALNSTCTSTSARRRSRSVFFTAADGEAVRRSRCHTQGVVTWRNGLAVDWRAHGQKEEALRDLGVAEDALERIAP